MSGEPWLILPTYNEAENVEAIVAAAGEVLARAAPEGFRVLVVDDGSPDGTGEIADALAAEHDWVQVLHRAEKNGIGPAYLAGFRHALGPRRGLRDGDGLRLLARPRRPRTAARRRARRRRPRARLALRARWRRERLGPPATLDQRGRLDLRAAACSACTCATSPAASSAFAARCSRRSTSTACARRATPSRSSSPTAPCGRASAWSRCRSSSATASTAEQDVLADRRRGDVARAAACASGSARARRC